MSVSSARTLLLDVGDLQVWAYVAVVSDSSPGPATVLLLSPLLDHAVVTRDTHGISGRAQLPAVFCCSLKMLMVNLDPV